MQTREIKFRTWDVFQQKMSSVANVMFGDDGDALTICFYTAPVTPIQRFLVHGESGILMQFTGLKDKNGKEIYEGDVVIIATRYPKKKIPQIVGWDNKSAQFCFVYETGEPMRKFHLATEVPFFEVVGNIYENPKLLKP